MFNVFVGALELDSVKPHTVCKFQVLLMCYFYIQTRLYGTSRHPNFLRLLCRSKCKVDDAIMGCSPLNWTLQLFSFSTLYFVHMSVLTLTIKHVT